MSDEPDPGYRRFDCRADDPDDPGDSTDPSERAEALEAARRAIEAGDCIVLPTDTVYGIGADAFSPDAVQNLLDAKIRGRDMPPPVLVADNALMRALATDIPEAAKELAEAHWPGPLTLILRAQPSLKMDLGETGGTVALRVPDHDLAREVLRRTGPMAVSSANISGLPAAQTVDEAVDQLGGRVVVYLDAGRLDASAGAPSTIVDFTKSETGEVVRRGALSLEVLRRTVPQITDLVEDDELEPGESEPGEPELAPTVDPEVDRTPGG